MGSNRPEGLPQQVLIIEDDADLRASIVQALSDAGYRVALAANGRDALEQLSRGARPDAILLDLTMPEMDGWEFRVRQKREPALASMPVIVATAATSSQAAAVDADVFLSKPFNRKGLLDSVATAVALGERRHADETLGHADRLASLGVLAAGLAHEIRNPLTAILLNLRIAEEELEGTPITRDHIARIADARRAAEHVNELMNEISRFARPDAPLEIVDLRAALESALSLVGAQLRSVAWLEHSHEPTPRVRAPLSHVVQVFVNLLINAGQAIEAARTAVIRTRTCTSELGDAVAEVTDSGCGIPPDRIGRIFDPFYSTKPPGQGTGLGLSISHRFIDQIGGRIEVESVPGCTTFRVVIPPADEQVEREP